MQNFRDSGYKHPVKTATKVATIAGELVAAPGAGKQVVIYDIIVAGTGGWADESLAGGMQVLRRGALGSVALYVPGGHTGFVAPFPFGENESVHAQRSGSASASTYTVTITYSIEPV
jgi:hypothetical protein